MRLLYYFKRIKTLGFQATLSRGMSRIQKKYYQMKLRYNQFFRSTITWKQFSKQYGIQKPEQLQSNLKAQNFILSTFDHEIFQRCLPKKYKDQNCVNKLAINATQHRFELFDTPFYSSGLTWQTDPKANKTWPNLFYADLKIECLNATTLDAYHGDIKVPWELSRMHQAVQLGLAYQYEITEKKEVYVKAFEAQTLDWIEKNQSYMGVNWVCPMDVAIRATNLIWAFGFFTTASLNETFLKRFFCSLHDHLTFLECNWETSATPNNHYLADLIGYAYLCRFFHISTNSKEFTKKLDWVLTTLTKQFELQFLADGTDYEGSTSYHRLVTELYLHFYLLVKNPNIKRQELLLKCLDFIACTQINETEFIQIGDTDSGKLVFGLEVEKNQPIKKIFENFGLTIIQEQNWLLSIRNNMRKKYQPSGHFHEDDLSVTISYNHRPIFVDPGSYLYTANSYARNFFRSYTMHNGPYLIESNRIPIRSYNLEKELFELPQNSFTNHLFDRTVEVSEDASTIVITDTIKNTASTNDEKQDLFVVWNFLVHPSINVTQSGQTYYFTAGTDHFILKSSLLWKIAPSYYATHYGIKEKTILLSAKLPFQETIITISLKRISDDHTSKVTQPHY